MKLIEIDRTTVKKNPNAGRTVFKVPGPWRHRFNVRLDFKSAKFKSSDTLEQMISKVAPMWLAGLILSKEVYITCMSSDGEISGEIMRSELVDFFKEQNITVSSSRQFHTERFITPEPDYFFKYKNTLIKCLCCGIESPRESIKYEYDDDGFCIERCPACAVANELESREYEKIDNVLKELK